jgi:hypothetical protein
MSESERTEFGVAEDASVQSTEAKDSLVAPNASHGG